SHPGSSKLSPMQCDSIPKKSDGIELRSLSQEEPEKSHLLVPGAKLMGHLESHQGAETKAAQKVRTLGLHFANFRQIVCLHRFDVAMARPVLALRLERKKWLLRPQALG